MKIKKLRSLIKECFIELATESVNEALAKGLKPLLIIGSKITKKVGEDTLLKLSDKFDRIDDEYAGTIASHLDMAIELMQDGYPGDASKKLKQFNKACKDVLKGKDVGSAFEGISEGLITEKFASKKVANINNKMKGQDKTIFKTLANAHGIAWDEVDDGFVTKGADTKVGMNFFFINSNKKNPYAKASSWDSNLYAGLLGVTIGKKVVHASRDAYSTTKSSRGASQMGMDNSEMNNFKRFNTLADEVWNVDYEAASSAHGTGEKTQARSEAKRGATAFLKARDIATDNKIRYEEILKDRIGNTNPGDQVSKMVDSIVKEYTKSIEVKAKMLKKGMVGRGWGGYLDTVSSAYTSIIREYEYFITEESNMTKGKAKDMEKNPDQNPDKWSEEKYYNSRMKDYARNIQKEYKKFKIALKKVDMDKSFYDIKKGY